MFKSIIVVILMLAVVNADIWSSCGSSTDKFQIGSVSIVPDPPVKGQTVTITASGVLSETIDGGNVHVNVKYGFITILNKDEPICQSGSPVPCPINAGNLNKTVSIAIPSNVPDGTYKANAVLTDTANNEIACINVDLHF
ncbi:putative phospholipid transfer protein [Heterostelium album PN500]|uniref:Putative phospholipid transfer protein n=1 Tax=Heterostelium pallidum (strain ATCC 26659 / Pp 5 / PN500) TaxID=670386 RepID=D3B330_HETP5|nr:putative phospholipid transfer protein [Heterostelium album PN500]EFA83728.1 putative phospholipid transfer protein [Heterostelium album PN500]|eukprot:XP_020435845.1 putative phospholipid transfer protein [Heterostelium album PN500]